MTVLYITQFSHTHNADGTLWGDLRPIYAVPYEPSVATTEALSFTTTTQSAAFDTNCTFIRLLSTGDCHIVWGASPTATTSHEKFMADVEYFRGIVPGQKLAVVDA
jgi:hypothetical protein